MVYQTPLIREADFNYLLILDACRFDFFKELYPKYLKGKLTKVRSPASNTPNWLRLTWPKYYDLTYFSANPYINSLGVPLEKYQDKSLEYISKNHFKTIIDVWNKGWNEQLGTVHPRAVNRFVKKTPHSKQNIVHYATPHAPYIGLDNKYSRPGSIYRNQLLNQKMPPKGNRRRPHRHLMIQAYKDTLELALQHVKQLLPHLNGTIILTADHGEALIEHGLWGKHPPNLNIDCLRDVPWFEVEK